MFGMTHPPTLRGKTYQGAPSAAEQKAQTLAMFEKYKIVKAVVAEGLSWKADMPDLVLAGGARASPDALRDQYDEGKLDVIAEMSQFYGGMLANDPALEPYFALAAEKGIPIGYHVFP